MCTPTALERRGRAEGMVEQRYITQAQADEANEEPLPTVKPSAELRPDNAWTQKAQDVLLNDPRLGATAQERRDKLLQGGLQVYTTLDPTLQQKADAAVSQGCDPPRRASVPRSSRWIPRRAT